MVPSELKAEKLSINPATDPVHARIATLDNVVVSHTLLQSAIDGITECISWSSVSSEPHGALLIGGGGLGKTTVCKAILKKFPPREVVYDDKIVQIIPAFYASVPSPSTIKSLARNLLQSLDTTNPVCGDASSMTKRLCKLLKICETKIILLDEFHHLLAEASAGERHANKVCNWIKSLINDTGVMVCLVGVPACESLVNYDTQISRRFVHRFRLNNLSIGTLEKPGDLKKFLVSMERKITTNFELEKFIDFNDDLNVFQVWVATSGNPAFVMLLFKEALAIALYSKRKIVVREDLAEVFDKGILLSVARMNANPFRMSQQQIITKLNTKNFK